MCSSFPVKTLFAHIVNALHPRILVGGTPRLPPQRVPNVSRRRREPGVAEALEELAVVSYDVVPYRDKTKAVRLQIVDAAAYAQLVLENQGRTLSVQDAAVELGRLRAIPLPPRAGEEPRV